MVGIAVPVTLALTLLLTYLFGYTLNRVTLFALVLLSCIVATRARAAPFDLAGQDWEACSELVQLAQAELGAPGGSRVVVTKRLPFGEAENGAIGLETMLAAGLRLVHAELLALPEA